MKPTEFRRELDRKWTELDNEAMVQKNSTGALCELIKLYERLDGGDRILADEAITEWIQSTNARKRFDALALVDQFRIQAAIPQLEAAETKLQRRTDPEAPYELAKVKRILERLRNTV